MTDHRGLGSAARAAASAADAPAKVRAQAAIAIDAPVERIWKLVVDIDQWPQWNKAVSKARFEGPLERGATFVWISGGFTIHSTMQDVVPMRRLSWSGRTFGTKAVHSWTFDVMDEGVLVTTTETFRGWLPMIMSKTMQKTLHDTLCALLASLKAAAESIPDGR